MKNLHDLDNIGGGLDSTSSEELVPLDEPVMPQRQTSPNNTAQNNEQQGTAVSPNSSNNNSSSDAVSSNTSNSYSTSHASSTFGSQNNSAAGNDASEESESDEWDMVDSQVRTWQWQVFGEFPFPWKDYPNGYWVALRDWIGPWVQIKDEILAGISVAVAQLPESVAFAIIAQVPPIRGLYTAFFMPLLCSFFGGRPGMISGATAAMAVVQAALMLETKGDLDFLYLTMIFVGVIEILIGVFQLAKLIRFVSKPTLMGFANGLAIVIFISQIASFRDRDREWGPGLDVLYSQNGSLAENLTLTNLKSQHYLDNFTVIDARIDLPMRLIQLEIPYIPNVTEVSTNFTNTLAHIGEVANGRVDVNMMQMGHRYYATVDYTDFNNGNFVDGDMLGKMLGMVFVTIFITLTVPYVTMVVPSPLIAISFCLFLEYAFQLHTLTVGDHSSLSGKIPQLRVPVIQWTYSNVKILVKYSLTLSAVALLQTLMTFQLVNNATNTRGQPNRECVVQGISNIVCGFFGAMGGCAMTGQSMMNLATGGRGRLSGVISAFLILLTILGLNVLIELIPIATLIGVMFVVVIHTFDFGSLLLMVQCVRRATFISLTNAMTILLVTGVTVMTNLAVAVFSGVVFESLCYVWESSRRLDVARKKAKVDHLLDVSGSGRRMTEYVLRGPLFFGSANIFQDKFDALNDGDDVVLDCAIARIMDVSALDALNVLSKRYYNLGKQLHLKGLNASAQRHILSFKSSFIGIAKDSTFDALPQDSYLISYDPRRKPIPMPVITQAVIENTCGRDDPFECPRLLCQMSECFVTYANNEELKWRNSIRIGRLFYHDKWAINLCEWSYFPYNFSIFNQSDYPRSPKDTFMKIIEKLSIRSVEEDLEKKIEKARSGVLLGFDKLREKDQRYLLSMMTPDVDLDSSTKSINPDGPEQKDNFLVVVVEPSHVQSDDSASIELSEREGEKTVVGLAAHVQQQEGVEQQANVGNESVGANGSGGDGEGLVSLEESQQTESAIEIANPAVNNANESVNVVDDESNEEVPLDEEI